MTAIINTYNKPKFYTGHFYIEFNDGYIEERCFLKNKYTGRIFVLNPDYKSKEENLAYFKQKNEIEYIVELEKKKIIFSYLAALDITYGKDYYTKFVHAIKNITFMFKSHVSNPNIYDSYN